MNAKLKSKEGVSVKVLVNHKFIDLTEDFVEVDLTYLTKKEYLSMSNLAESGSLIIENEDEVRKQLEKNLGVVASDYPEKPKPEPKPLDEEDEDPVTTENPTTEDGDGDPNLGSGSESTQNPEDDTPNDPEGSSTGELEEKVVETETIVEEVTETTQDALDQADGNQVGLLDDTNDAGAEEPSSDPEDKVETEEGTEVEESTEPINEKLSKRLEILKTKGATVNLEDKNVTKGDLVISFDEVENSDYHELMARVE